MAGAAPPWPLVTTTAESEYSPLVTPSGTSVSVVRVEADGTQRLWQFDLDGSNPRLVLETVKPVGYHVWIDRSQLALFVLGSSGQPATLQLASTAPESSEVVASAIGRSLQLPPEVEALSEIQRVVTIFRELRSGTTLNQRTTIKQPSSTLSTAEAISVMTNGLALAAHFGDGRIRADDVAASLTGAVVKDPVQDRIVWQEYLETVVKDRAEWADLYRSCRELG